MEIINGLYEANDTGSARLIEVLTQVFPWDGVEQVDESKTRFYKDCGDAKRVGISYAGYNSYGHTLGIFAEDTESGTVIGNVSASSNGDYWLYLNIIADTDVISVAGGSDTQFPYTDYDYRNVGVGTTRTPDGAAAGYGAWYSAFSGTSTQNLAVLDKFSDKYYTTSHTHQASSRMLIAQKVVNKYSATILDKPLLIECTPDAYMGTVGYLNWNGRRYYKNGSILIPAE